MMKCFLLLLTLLLAGCSARPAVPPEVTDPVTADPVGWYAPESQLETETHGALACYPIQEQGTCRILPMGEDILLFSAGDNCTMVTRLTGPKAVPADRMTLGFRLEPGDPALRLTGSGFSCYDPSAREVLIVDGDLTITARISAPGDMRDGPLLSHDGKSLYYCAPDGIRVLDIAAGISRILRRCDTDGIQLQTLAVDDRVLQYRLTQGETTQTRFLSTKNGFTLQHWPGDVTLETQGEDYWARLQQGNIRTLVFGTGETETQSILFPQPGTDGVFLPTIHGALGILSQADTVKYEYYDLKTGSMRAAISLPSACRAEQVLALAPDKIWFLAGDTLYCWNPTGSPIRDSRDHTAIYYPRDNPDPAGLAECRLQASRLAEHYGIRILIREESQQSAAFRISALEQTALLRQTLTRLEQAMSRYPEPVWEALATRFQGFTICIAAQVQWVTPPKSPDPSCQALVWEDYHPYILLTPEASMERSLNHSLCHLMDTIVLNGSSAYDTWAERNPTGFVYDYDYEANRSRNSTAYLQEWSRYFVDMYAMSFPKEDRARIWEAAMQSNQTSLFQSRHIMNKLQALCLGVREAFKLEDWPEPLLWEQYLQP